MSADRRIHIVGFGNLLAGDDGLGIHAIERLRALDWSAHPAEVSILDGGIAGFSALTFFEDCDAVVLIDALGHLGHEGRVHQLRLDEVAAPRAAFSAHSLDLNHLVHVLPILFEDKAMPEIRIIGTEIRPHDGTYSMTMSSKVEQSLETIVTLVQTEVRLLSNGDASRPDSM